MYRHTAIPWVAALITAASCSLWSGSQVAHGCNIPVFRYALENWVPDNFRVLVVSQGPLAEAEKTSLQLLNKARDDQQQPANLVVDHFDVEASSLSDVLTLEEHQPSIPAWALERLAEVFRTSVQQADGAQMFLLYPQIWDRFAWQAPLTEENVQRLVDSPARQEIARRLLDGQSAVWVLLESKHGDQNEAAWQRLQTELDRTSKVVELPAEDLIIAEEEYRPDVAIELRVEFSALRLRRDDPDEAAFAAMLRASEADLAEFDEPIAIPIYGRGRTYFALVGQGINPEMVEQNGRFICGACSCEVKRDNPGTDLLFAMNWDSAINGSVMSNIPLPELTGIGGLQHALPVADAGSGKTDSSATEDLVQTSLPAAAMASASTATDDDVTSPDVASDAPREDPSAASADEGHFHRRLVYGLAVGVGLAVGALALISFWMAKRPA